MTDRACEMSDVALYSGELIVMSLERVGALNDYRQDEGS